MCEPKSDEESNIETLNMATKKKTTKAKGNHANNFHVVVERAEQQRERAFHCAKVDKSRAPRHLTVISRVKIESQIFTHFYLSLLFCDAQYSICLFAIDGIKVFKGMKNWRSKLFHS